MKGSIIRTDKGNETTFNESGEPIIVSQPEENPISCLYYATKLNNYGATVDGTFVQSSYVITTKDLTFQANRIKLLDMYGEIVCEKDVLSRELLYDVKRVKITV